MQAHRVAHLPQDHCLPMGQHIKCGTHSKCHNALFLAQHGTCCKQHTKKGKGPSNMGSREKGGSPQAANAVCVRQHRQKKKDAREGLGTTNNIGNLQR